jgi:hypothetical protein
VRLSCAASMAAMRGAAWAGVKSIIAVRFLIHAVLYDKSRIQPVVWANRHSIQAKA